jgi:hypothetical protein
MNQPEYIPVDVMGEIVANVKTALTLPVLNYQYGEIDELTSTLQQWTKSKGSAADKAALKFPLVWFVQPFIIERGTPGYYGLLKDAKVFFVAQTQKGYKAEQRMTNIYKPIIYPIYREFLNQTLLQGAFTGSGEELGIGGIKHTFVDRYYFGEELEAILGDVVDCSVMFDLELWIQNNPNCSTFKAF